jgi:anti-sigma factor RsiW
LPIREITCQELVEVVTDYIEDRLSPERRLLFEEHLAFCSWCVTYVEQMRQTILSTGALREDDLEPHVRDAMLNVFRDWKVS